MSRSVKKGPFVAFSLVKKINAMNEANENKIVKTWSRASTILPSFVGHTLHLLVPSKVITRAKTLNEEEKDGSSGNSKKYPHFAS